MHGETVKVARLSMNWQQKYLSPLLFTFMVM